MRAIKQKEDFKALLHLCNNVFCFNSIEFPPLPDYHFLLFVLYLVFLYYRMACHCDMDEDLQSFIATNYSLFMLARHPHFP